MAEKRRRQLESKIRNQYKETLKTPKNPLDKVRSNRSAQQDNRQARRDHVNNTLAVYIDDDVRNKAISLYEDEINNNGAYDLGNMGPNRYSLYKVVEKAIGGGLKLDKTKSSSNMSSVSRESQHEGKSNESVLTALVRERNTMAKLGFLERAEEIDAEIKEFTSKVNEDRKAEEKRIYKEQEVALDKKLERRSNRVLVGLEQEENALHEIQKEELNKLIRRQVDEFTKLIEDTKRRAVGKAKTCNCMSWYACTHNKSSSYKTRRSKPEVIILKRNGDRLRRKGLTEEAQVWNAKALELDHSHQQLWQQRMSQSIGAGSWGPNESVLDKLIGRHKRDMNQLLEDQRVAKTTLKVKHQRKKEILENVIKAKKNRLKVQVRKFYLNMLEERTRLELLQDGKRQANFGDDLWDIMSDDMAEEQLKMQEEKKNTTASKKDNRLKYEKDTEVYWNAMAHRTEEQEQWVPPTTTGLNNSDRLVRWNTEKVRTDTNLEATERELKVRGYDNLGISTGYTSSTSNANNVDDTDNNNNNTGTSNGLSNSSTSFGLGTKDSIGFDSIKTFDSKIGFANASFDMLSSAIASPTASVVSSSSHQPSPPVSNSPSSSSLNSLNKSIRTTRIKDANEESPLLVKIDNGSLDKNNHAKFASEKSDEKGETGIENKGDQNSSTKFGGLNNFMGSLSSLSSLGEFSSPMDASHLNAPSNVSSASDISFRKDINQIDTVVDNSDNTPQQAFNSSALFKPLGSLSFGEAGENEEVDDDEEQEDENSRSMSRLNNFGTSFGFGQSKSFMFPYTTNSVKNTLDMSGYSSPMVSGPMNSLADFTQLSSGNLDSDTESVQSISMTSEKNAGVSLGGEGLQLGSSALFNSMGS